jgi:hypothetical protein
MEKKEQIINTIKNNLNFIYIGLMIFANCLLALLKVEDGKIGVHYPSTVLGWIMFILQIVLTATVAVLILNGFRRQGIKTGHDTIKEVYDNYIKAITKPVAEHNPRSLKKYMQIQKTKDGLQKGASYVIINIFVMSVAIGANWNNLLTLIIDIVFAVGFGIKAMLDAEEYVVTELVIWYQLETKKANELNESLKGESTQNELLQGH